MVHFTSVFLIGNMLVLMCIYFWHLSCSDVFHIDMTLMVVLGIEKQYICLSVFRDDVCVYVCVCLHVVFLGGGGV